MTPPAGPELESIAAGLSELSERLAEVALDLLRSATRAGEPQERDAAAALERRVTRARRAVDKAAGLLAHEPEVDPA